MPTRSDATVDVVGAVAVETRSAVEEASLGLVVLA
jgi:hypothetical protein